MTRSTNPCNKVAPTLLSICLAASLCACGAPPDEWDSDVDTVSQPIWVGEDTAYPAVVRVNIGGWCSGSKINDRVILTAAHCVTDRIAKSDWTEITITDRDGDARGALWDFIDDVKIKQFQSTGSTAGPNAYLGKAFVYIPPEYVYSYGGYEEDGHYYKADIAVIYLWDGTPDWNSNSKLALHAGKVNKGGRYDIFGWGTDTTYSSETAGILRKGKDGAKIKIAWSGSRHFVAEAGSARICSGDSGGPAVRTQDSPDRLVGVASNSQKKYDDRKCPSEDHKMRWTEINNEGSVGGWADWIDAIVERRTNKWCRSDVSADGQDILRCW